MKAIISRTNSVGAIAEVGTSDRTIVSHYKTHNGVMRYARKYAQGKTFRVQFFHDSEFYGNPYRCVTVRQGGAL